MGDLKEVKWTAADKVQGAWSGHFWHEGFDHRPHHKKSAEGKHQSGSDHAGDTDEGFPDDQKGSDREGPESKIAEDHSCCIAVFLYVAFHTTFHTRSIP